MSSTKLKTTFNTASTLYEEIRPGYPEKLIEDVLDISGIENNSRILEVGCGTGKATRPFAESQSLYDQYYLPLTADRPTHATDVPGVETFRSPIRRVYPWTQTYSSKQYIKLLNTYSDHIALPDKNKRLLFEGIVNLIETKYNGQITKHYEAVLDLRETQ